MSKTKIPLNRGLISTLPINRVICFDGEENPAEIYGGIWLKIAKGRVPMGASEKYPLHSEGGEETHTLTIDEMPSHEHSINVNTLNNITASPKYGPFVQGNMAYSWDWNGTDCTSSSGKNQPHNNIQPYYAVNFWKRVG